MSGGMSVFVVDKRWISWITYFDVIRPLEIRLFLYWANTFPNTGTALPWVICIIMLEINVTTYFRS